MMTTSETFFRPDETGRTRVTIPAPLYNLCRLLLSRCPTQNVFVPIRSMQIMAVIGPDEVIFVDSQAYAVQDGAGGKLIFLAWSLLPAAGREDLSAPAPVQLRYYRDDARELHGRLVGEFGQELAQLLERLQQEGCPPRSSRVVPLRA